MCRAIDVLLAAGARPDGRSLATAAGAGAECSVAALLDGGADAASSWDEVGFDALLAAAMHGHVGIVTRLARSGRDVDAEVSRRERQREREREREGRR